MARDSLENLPEMGNVRVYIRCQHSSALITYHTSTHDISRIAVPLGGSIQQQVQLALHRLVVLRVVQRSCCPSAGDDAVVGLLRRAARHARGIEYGPQLLLVLHVVHLLQHRKVRRAADFVGLLDERNLVVGLDDAGDLDGLLEDGEILGVILQEGDVVGNLLGDGKDCGLGAFGAEVREGCVDVVCVLDLVDVVQLEGLLGGGRQTRPYNRLRIDGRDEQRGLGRGYVVDVMAVGQLAAGYVVEEAPLSGG